MKIIYLIGPDFTVFSLAYPHLKYLIEQKNKYYYFQNHLIKFRSRD